MTPAGTPEGNFPAPARDLRDPLLAAPEPAALLQELVRCATLAANGHNTQPWSFELAPDQITIRPDYARRTPVVDPDDHHLWVSLGCATENLIIAAAALGRHAELEFNPAQIHIRLARSTAVKSPLVNAIFRRQCTRTVYDGQPIPSYMLQDLERAHVQSGVRLLLLSEPAKIGGVLDYVTQANSAQMHDPAFITELKQWIRFNESQALQTGDGLAMAVFGNASVPAWLGQPLFGLFFREAAENDRYAKQLRSSSAVAVFVGASDNAASWFEVGRAYERFALTATALGVRTAFVNQPVEVPAVRAPFAAWLGIGSQRPDLLVRLGRSALLPYSARRPVGTVIA